jgi:hypothetical protein
MFKLLLFFLLPAVSFAAPTQSQRNDFADLIKTYKLDCPNGTCVAPFAEKLLLDRTNRVQDPGFVTVKKQTQKVAHDQAQIWGDTILEGDYTAGGPTRMDRVIAIYQNDVIVAYRITYSEKAWSLAECDYDGTPESLKTCPTGRIVESSFTTPVFDYNLTDEDDYATFVAN